MLTEELPRLLNVWMGLSRLFGAVPPIATVRLRLTRTTLRGTGTVSAERTGPVEIPRVERGIPGSGQSWTTARQTFGLSSEATTRPRSASAFRARGAFAAAMPTAPAAWFAVIPVEPAAVSVSTSRVCTAPRRAWIGFFPARLPASGGRAGSCPAAEVCVTGAPHATAHPNRMPRSTMRSDRISAWFTCVTVTPSETSRQRVAAGHHHVLSRRRSRRPIPPPRAARRAFPRGHARPHQLRTPT